MPKMKSKSAAKKRFRATASGLFKRGSKGRRHKFTHMRTKRKRHLRKQSYVDKAQDHQVAAMLPYAR